MKILKRVLSFLERTLFNPKWKCLCCGRENFNDDYICEECRKTLPVIEGSFCGHCGRKTVASEAYCTTCKNTLVSLDKGRSLYEYKPPVSTLIRKLKYNGRKYVADFFAKELSSVYLRNFTDADFITFVPSTAKSRKARGYNQSELLARNLAEIVGTEVKEVCVKIKETPRQAKLTRAQRLTNLTDAFKVTDRRSVIGKTILIIDDVTTTGSTVEAIASKLKRAGAERVCLLTVASVSPKNGY